MIDDTFKKDDIVIFQTSTQRQAGLYVTTEGGYTIFWVIRDESNEAHLTAIPVNEIKVIVRAGGTRDITEFLDKEEES